MHTNDPIVYTSITPEHFSNIEKLAQSHGLSVVSTNGQTKKDGVEIAWDYNISDQTLTVTVKQTPFWMPENVVESYFNDCVKKTQPAQPAQSVSEATTQS